MLNGIKIQNFKCFLNKQSIPLKPLSIICGRNSSGKSSCIQSLLLLKQSLNIKENSPNSLQFLGPFIQRDSIGDFFFKGSKNINTTSVFSFTIDDFEIEYTFQDVTLKNDIPITAIQCYRIIKKSGENIITLTKGNESFYDFSSSVVTIDDFLAKTPFKKEKNNIKFVFVGLTPFIHHKISDNSALRLPLPVFFRALDIFSSCKLNNVHDRLLQTLSKLRYLGPVRAQPQSAYMQYLAVNLDLDSNGSNVAQIIWRLQKQKVKGYDAGLTFQDLLNKYLDLLGIKQTIRVSRREKIVYSIDLSLTNDNTQFVPISDVGFGVSQVLPVILNGLLTEPSEISIFEQPEIHLHPECKGKLADVFLDFVKHGRQIIVETHSSELIDNLRLKIIEDPSLKEIVNIIFIEDSDNGSARVRIVDLDEDGIPLDWPAGFCDTAASTARKMLIARNRRQKQQVAK